jgi:hypothetical protein
MPPGAAPGQQLQPDLSVSGAPPGYAPGACIAQSGPVAGPPPVIAPPFDQRYVIPLPPLYRPYVVAPPPPYYRPYVIAPAPPPVPRFFRRRVIVRPRSDVIVAPYAPSYRGRVRVEVGPGGVSFGGRIR